MVIFFPIYASQNQYNTYTSDLGPLPECLRINISLTISNVEALMKRIPRLFTVFKATLWNIPGEMLLRHKINSENNGIKDGSE